MNLRPGTKTELIRRLQDPETKLIEGTMRQGDCFCLVGLIADVVDSSRWCVRNSGYSHDQTAYDWFWSKDSKTYDLYQGIPEESLDGRDVWEILTFSDDTVDKYNDAKARALLVAWVVRNL